MLKKVFVGNEVQNDGSIIFSEKENPNGPHPTTRPATIDFNEVPVRL